MSEVVPIRPGQEVRADPVRDLCAYVTDAITAFAEHDEPVAIGFTVIGRKKVFPGGFVVCEEKTLAEALAFSGAMLINRATQGE